MRFNLKSAAALSFLTLSLIASAAACGGKSSSKAPPTPVTSPTAAITPGPTQTFASPEQRAQVIAFLAQVCQISNAIHGMVDTVSSEMSSGTPIQTPDSFAAALVQLSAFQVKTSAMQPPADIPELAQLQTASQQALDKMAQIFDQLIPALQAGNKNVQTLLQQLVALKTDAVSLKPDVLIQDILGKYGIPDYEVGYRRPQ